jgi:hypothetical protein
VHRSLAVPIAAQFLDARDSATLKSMRKRIAVVQHYLGPAVPIQDRAYAVLLFAASGQRQSMTSENWPASLTNTPENEAQRDFDRK